MCAACAAGDDSPACGQSLYQVCTDSQGQASFCSACQSDFGSRECVAARQAYLSECVEKKEVMPSAGSVLFFCFIYFSLCPFFVWDGVGVRRGG